MELLKRLGRLKTGRRLLFKAAALTRRGRWRTDDFIELTKTAHCAKRSKLQFFNGRTTVRIHSIRSVK